MKKIIIKYLIFSTVFFISIIAYLSVFGLETEKFNNQIKNKLYQTNNNLEIELKKIELTLDPLNFKINAKTIGTNVVIKGKRLKLEYIKTQISLLSLLKSRFISSNLEFSSRSILLKDLATFAIATTGRSELFILQKAIQKGQVIFNVKLNFDENGKIQPNYKISATVRDGSVKFFKNYKFKNINFFLDIRNNIYDFKDINFTTNKTDFVSKNLKVIQNKKDFLFEGDIQNKNSLLNNELLKLLNFNFKDLKFLDTNFTSYNKFSFNINNRLKIKDLIVASEIEINQSGYLKPSLFNDYTSEINDIILIKDHKIKTKYKKEDFILEGSGKIKLEKEFDDIKYKLRIKENDFNLFSNIKLSALKLKSQKFLKSFFPKLNESIDLKNHKIDISYDNNNLSVKGSGKIKLEKKYEDINFYFLKDEKRLNFETKLNFEKTSLNIDFLDFKKSDNLKTQLKILGNYNKKNELNFNEIKIIEKKNKIFFENFVLDKDFKIIKIDKIDLDYFDTERKRNKLLLKRKDKKNYSVKGLLFNANKLIENLLNSKDDSKIFKNNVNLSLDLKKVYIGNEDIVSNLKGKLDIRGNKVFKADVTGFFDENENLIFTVNTNSNDEKITTLYSSRAKPIVSKYKFIKGYEEGYLDFYSLKKDNFSKSKLNIYNFKLQKLPALTKLLTLASLQGIADILSGEGIRFDEFEMNFDNQDNLITINEIYAIGPAISILMSGYVEKDELISLRGTLVPATTINRSISSIPFLGKILVGDKTGEGVFGVSFKIKGPPKKLETTVNPIKTLTPRFITRTLEKIKKN